MRVVTVTASRTFFAERIDHGRHPAAQVVLLFDIYIDARTPKM
jgi:hypothetical protein